MNWNIESLLKPIPGENPAGEDMSTSSEREVIDAAGKRRLKIGSIDDAGTEWEDPDWDKVENVAKKILTESSKDLFFAVRLAEAMSRKYPFHGLNSGLLLVHRLLVQYWDDLYPTISEDNLEHGLELRKKDLEWLSERLAKIIESSPLCAYEEKDFLNNREPLQRSKQNLTELDNAVKQHFAMAMSGHPDKTKVTSITTPDFSALSSALNERCARFEEQQLSVKNDVSLPKALNNAVANGSSVVQGVSIQTRADAFRLLAEVSTYFKKNEPHNPMPYLLDRAIKWSDMPLDQWLHEMVNEGWTDIPALLKLIGK